MGFRQYLKPAAYLRNASKINQTFQSYENDRIIGNFEKYIILSKKKIVIKRCMDSNKEYLQTTYMLFFF